MNTVDDDIRTLLREALHDSPTPLSADELSRHVTVVPLNARADRRPRLLVAACLLVIAGAAAGFVVFGRAHDADSPPTNDAVAGTKVGTYYLPAQLPEGYELLSVSEHAGNPAATGSARAVYAHVQSGARVMLWVVPREGASEGSAQTATLPDGSVGWGSFETPDGVTVTNFQLDLRGTLINGESRGVEADDLLTLFRSVRIDGPTGIPEVTEASYSMLASSAVANPVVAEWTAIFGKPGAYLGMSELVVRVQRFANPIDVTLDEGVWSGTSKVNDRTIHGGWMDEAPVWFPTPDLRVSSLAYGDSDDETARQTLATMHEVDEAEFQQLVDTIEITAETLDVGDSVTFPSGAFVELLGDADDPRGMCLTVSGTRRCDLALMDRSGYSADDRFLAARSDFLINGEWFTVAVDRSDMFNELSATETVGGDDRTWYLVEHPSDALVSDPTQWSTALTRPAR